MNLLILVLIISYIPSSFKSLKDKKNNIIYTSFKCLAKGIFVLFSISLQRLYIEISFFVLYFSSSSFSSSLK